MKKFTIEQKARAYDEAIEKAKDCLKDGTITSTAIDYISTIFPELKEDENEDERIRKYLISFVELNSGFNLPPEDAEQIIAWLEKQGEKKTAVTDFNAKDWYVSKVDGKIHDMTYNPVNKVESKFKVGDWIIFYGGNPFKILKVEQEQNGILDYLLLDQNGCDSYYNKKYVDENARLWTIQDAKDGDVLVGGEQLFLFKRMNTSNSFYAHCNYHFIGYDSLSVYDCSYSIDNIYPAAEKQRDFLFQKIREAGWEFDFEKKELKKIERKTAENKGMNLVEEEMTPFQKKVFSIIDTAIEEEQGLKQVCDELFALASNEIMQKSAWSEEDEAHIDSLLKRLKGICKPGAAFISTRFAISEDEDWLKSLKNRVHQKQGWSKEDEKEVAVLEAYIRSKDWSDRHIDRALGIVDELVNKVKSLKGRVQPKQEWSEEDENLINSIIKDFETIAKGDLAKDCPQRTKNYIPWLKSLKDRAQPKAELTQLDKNILEAAIAFVEQNNHFNYWCGVDKHTVLSALYSLRPQKYWKPSKGRWNN